MCGVKNLKEVIRDNLIIIGYRCIYLNFKLHWIKSDMMMNDSNYIQLG